MATGSLDPEDEKKKLRAIKKCFVELNKDMNPEDMMPELYSRKLLTKNEMERLGLPLMTRSEKNTFILIRLQSKGKGAFDYFVDALQATSEENPAHSELVDLLLKELNNDT